MNVKELGQLNYLCIKNVRAIDLIEMKLEGESFVPVVGPNGSGKSTVLDSLMMMFNGGAVPQEIIKDGGSEAQIIAGTTNNVRITKRIRKNAKGVQVSDIVMQKDNKAIAAPQKILKELFGGFITPNKIATSSGAALYKSIKEKVSADLDGLEEEVQKATGNYNGINYSLKNMIVPNMPEGEDPGDMTYNAADHEKHMDRVAAYKDKLIKKTELYELSEEMKAKIQLMEDRLDSLRSEQNLINNFINEKKPAYEESLKKSDSYKNILANIDLSNQWSSYKEHLTRRKETEREVSAAKELKLAAETNLSTAYASIDTGVDSLKLTEDKSVILNGIPWENNCFSERMKTAALLSIKNLDESKLPIMFIEHGESLSVNKRHDIAKAAIDKGAIVFIEVFKEDTSGETEGIILTAPDHPYIPAADVEEVEEAQTVESVEIQSPKDLGLKQGKDIWGDIE